MSLETALYIHQLNAANPAGSDRLAQGDDHLRLIKAVLKSTFPNLTGPLNVTQDFLNTLGDSLVPFGTIALTAAPVAPTGWAFCHGQEVTRSDGASRVTLPDLRDVVVVGAAATKPVGTRFGEYAKAYTTETAGDHTHTASTGAAGSHTHGTTIQGTALSIEHLPPHKHGNGITHNTDAVFNHGTLSADPNTPRRTDGNGNSGTLEGYTTTVGSGVAHGHGVTETASGAHTHTVSVASGGGHAHNLVIATAQPSFTLNYMMKI